MTHHPCPQCHTLNAAANPGCARCGASFRRQTIIYSADADAPYRVEMEESAPPGSDPVGHIGRAVALTAASVAAEVALGYAERRFLRGRPVASGHARRIRNGALTTLTGAALVLAEQVFAVPGRPY